MWRWLELSITILSIPIWIPMYAWTSYQIVKEIEAERKEECENFANGQINDKNL